MDSGIKNNPGNILDNLAGMRTTGLLNFGTIMLGKPIHKSINIIYLQVIRLMPSQILGGFKLTTGVNESAQNQVSKHRSSARTENFRRDFANPIFSLLPAF